MMLRTAPFLTLVLISMACLSQQHLVEHPAVVSVADWQGSPPEECTDGWAPDRILCRIKGCQDGDHKLDCNFDDTTGTQGGQVQCELANLKGGPAVDFSCPAAGGRVQCMWGQISGRLPGCAVGAVFRILQAWEPARPA